MRCGVSWGPTMLAMICVPLLLAAPLHGQAAGGEPPVYKLQRLEALYKSGDPDALPFLLELATEADERFKENVGWHTAVGAHIGLAFLQFGDIELAAHYLDYAINELEEGALRRAANEAAGRIKQELARIDAWRSRYATMVAETEAALDAGREPPTLGQPGPTRKGFVPWEANFRVLEVTKDTPSELVVRIDATIFDRLKVGDEGYLRTTEGLLYNVRYEGIGTAKIISAGRQTLVKIEYHNGSTNHELKPGLTRNNYVMFVDRVRYNRRGEESIIRDLASMSVGFISPFNGHHYYDMALARVFDDSVPPQVTLARMARDMRMAATMLRDQPPSERIPGVDTVLKDYHGKSGLTIMDAMDRATADEIYRFLQYFDPDRISRFHVQPGDFSLLHDYIGYLKEEYGT